MPPPILGFTAGTAIDLSSPVPAVPDEFFLTAGSVVDEQAPTMASPTITTIVNKTIVTTAAAATKMTRRYGSSSENDVHQNVMEIQELLKSLEAGVAGSAPNVAHIRTQLNVIEERYLANKKAKVDRDSGSKEEAPAVPAYQRGQQQELGRSTLQTPALGVGGSRLSLAFAKAIGQPDWSGTRKWDRLVRAAQNKPDRLKKRTRPYKSRTCR